MLTRVQITNFKSIGEGPEGPEGAPGAGVDIALKPLTFLVGPNGGGKSSILEAIAWASQEGRLIGRLLDTFDPGFQSARLSEQRPLGYRGFLHKLDETRLLMVTLRPSADWAKLVPAWSYVATRNTPPEMSLKAIDPANIQGFRVFCLLHGKSDNESRDELGSLRERLGTQVFLLAATRGLVRNESRASGNDPQWVGRNGQDLVALLAVISRQEYAAKRAAISKVMVDFGMKDPWAGWKSESVLGGQYEDPNLETVLDASNASQGGRQALAVVTQIQWSAPFSVTMVEEPEISLHPKAQLDMTRFLAEHAGQKEKQIIATTHSPFMLLALQYPIEEHRKTKGQKGISPDQVAVYEVERDKQTGATVAKPLPMSKDGYLKNWVPSFSKVEKRLLRDWLKTLPEA